MGSGSGIGSSLIIVESRTKDFFEKTDERRGGLKDSGSKARLESKGYARGISFVMSRASCVRCAATTLKRHDKRIGSLLFYPLELCY